MYTSKKSKFDSKHEIHLSYSKNTLGKREKGCLKSISLKFHNVLKKDSVKPHSSFSSITGSITGGGWFDPGSVNILSED